jgi:NADH-quinone oxidoreductase subunit C
VTDAVEEVVEAPEPQETLHGVPVTRVRGQAVLHVDVAGYRALLEALAADGFEVCLDVTAVDYLTHPGRTLPEGIVPQRFEVMVNLLSQSRYERIRVRCQVPADAAVVPTVTDLWAGADAAEREAFDMFGIVFEGHPDLSRILMPEDWEGHPLRKDYGVGRIPVQFKGSPGAR